MHLQTGRSHACLLFGLAGTAVQRPQECAVATCHVLAQSQYIMCTSIDYMLSTSLQELAIAMPSSVYNSNQKKSMSNVSTALHVPNSTFILSTSLQELAIARSGQTSDPSAGRRAMDATFGSDCNFRMGYLTKQNAAWAVLVSELAASCLNEDPKSFNMSHNL